MSAITVPSGMLRISKEGEKDRIIYPVHADGWRAIGWTVHAPEPDPEEEEGDEADMPALVGDDDPGFTPSDPGVNDDETVAADLEPLDLDGLTKAEIVAAVAERYGVQLDPSDTRAELVAAAAALATPSGGDAAAGASAQGVEADAADLVVPTLI